MRKMTLVLAASLLLIVSVAVALNLDTVIGTWSNLTGPGAPGTFVTVGNENQVRWGNPFGGGQQSGLGFSPNSALPLLDLLADEEFEIGPLRHFNNPIFLGSAADGVDLTIDLGFSDPVLSASSAFTLSINETLNFPPFFFCQFGGSPPCPDIISFPNSFPGEIFNIDGMTFALQIVGFRITADGPLLSEFSSEEGGTNTILLFGQLTLVCVRTQGFWKNHPDDWPVDELDLGTVAYTQDELLDILSEPVRGNGLISLAYQLIAAKLNNAAAPVVPPSVQSVINDADALIDGLLVPPIGTDFLHPRVTSALIEILDEYNNGLTPDGPVSCDEIEEEEEENTRRRRK